MRSIRLGALLLGGALVLSACGSSGGVSGAVAQMSAWVTTTNLGDTIAGLQQDAAKITTETERHADRLTMQTLCGILLVDVESANSNLPAPDLVANEHLANGLQFLGDGAHRCYSAGATNVALQVKSAADRSRGLIELARGLSAIEAILGRPIPTTTTTTTAP